jgi:pimeloyl-ACP methyl ester carboxylesterase
VIGLLDYLGIDRADLFGESFDGIVAILIAVRRIEHSVETYKTIPNGELAIIPDAAHFVSIWDQQKVIPAIETFLSGPSVKIPFATTETGYHPGETR